MEKVLLPQGRIMVNGYTYKGNNFTLLVYLPFQWLSTLKEKNLLL